MVPTQSRLAIVADDLTGLQAISAEFSKLGIRVRTVLSCEDLALEPGDQVIGVDTDSRHLDSSQAAQMVVAVISKLRSLGIRYIYKQADSGMQGPLAAEIESAMYALGAPSALYAPSCPVLGRVTRGGRQQDSSGLDVDIQSLWHGQTGHRPLQTEASDWRMPTVPEQPQVYLVNADTDAQLRRLARTAWPLDATDTPSPCLLAGSVGLASAVANLWRMRWKRPGEKPALVVAGSQQQQTRRQIEHLADAVEGLILDITDSPLNPQEIMRLVASALASVRRGEHVIVLAIPTKDAVSSKDGYPLLHQEARLQLNRNLVQVLSALFEHSAAGLWSGVLVAGGGTSDLVARDVLGIQETQVTAWLAPGVAGSLARCASGAHMPFVTKAGT